MSLLVGVQSYAGNEGGGGVGFLCGNKVYLADTYSTMKDLEDDYLEEYKKVDENQIIFEAINNADWQGNMMREYIKGLNFDDVQERENAEKILKFLNSKLLKEIFANLSFTPAAEVPLAGDDNIKEVPDGCKKIPIAYQYIKKSEVIYDKTYYAGLSKIDRAYLKLHEVLINIEGGTSDTTHIRDTISIIMQLSGLAKSEENKQVQCNKKNYVRFFGWKALRSLSFNYENIDIDKYSKDGKLTGKFNSDVALKSHKLSDYISPENLDKFIEQSYASLIVLWPLIHKKDKNPFPKDGRLNEVRNHYMKQSWDASYSQILKERYSKLTVCDYVNLVNATFKLDGNREFGRELIERQERERDKYPY